MEFDSKSKEGRRGKNRRRGGGGKSKEEKPEREVEETANNSEMLSSRRYSADLANKNVQETSLDLVIADDGEWNTLRSSVFLGCVCA